MIVRDFVVRRLTQSKVLLDALDFIDVDTALVDNTKLFYSLCSIENVILLTLLIKGLHHQGYSQELFQ
jgi:hypothetical protein